MAENRGKKFEQIIQSCFQEVNNTSVVRLHDQTTGYRGSSNHCDFIVYHKPYELHLECKSVHGNTLSIFSNPKSDKHGVLHGFYGNITDAQWQGLLDRSIVPGVVAGVICWWVDKDVTRFLPIQLLEEAYLLGQKSIRYDDDDLYVQRDKSFTAIPINGKKKRIFFEYDMEEFFNEISISYR